MLAEFWRAMEETLHSAHKARSFTIDALPSKVFVEQAGKITEHEVEPPDRGHTIGSFESLVALAGTGAAPEIFVSPSAVDVVLNKVKRRDVASVSLNHSCRFAAIVGLVGGKAFTQEGALSFLRYDLGLTDDDDIVKGLRSLRFKRTTEGSGTVQHDGQAYGLKVDEESEGAAPVPPVFEATAAVYSTPGFDEYDTSFDIGVQLRADTQKIEFRIGGDDGTDAIFDTVARIVEDLRGQVAEADVYHGRA